MPKQIDPAPPMATDSQCIYYAGFMGDGGTKITHCRAGVEYDSLLPDDDYPPGFYSSLPCTRNRDIKQRRVSCEHHRLPTREELEASDVWLHQHMKFLFAARERVLTDCKGQGGVTGAVECPQCEGTLQYSTAPSRHSRHAIIAKCDTENCLHFQ